MKEHYRRECRMGRDGQSKRSLESEGAVNRGGLKTGRKGIDVEGGAAMGK